MDNDAQHPTVTLDQILITGQLTRRPAPPPNYTDEVAALHAVGRALTMDAQAALDALVDAALRLCRAGSAGVSLLEEDAHGQRSFRWVAMAGAYASYRGGTTPYDISPCGATLARGVAQLFDRPSRLFTDMRRAEPPEIIENLVVPFRSGDVEGTIWVATHDDQIHFTNEDARILTSLGDFTAVALAGQRVRSRHQASEARLAQIVESVRDYAMFTMDRDGIVTSWNVGADKVFGYGQDEIIGRTSDEIWTPEDLARDEPHKERERARTDGRAADERWHMRNDGTRFFASGILTPLLGDDGRLVGYTKVCRDITERKRAEERANRILESITDAFYAVDRQWRFTYVNAGAERLLHRRREELIGRVIWDEFPSALGTEFERQYNRTMNERVTTQFVEFYPAPLEGWYDIRAYPSPEGISVYFQDINERKRDEDALRASEERFALAVDAAELGTFHWTLPVGRIEWNRRLREFFWMSPDETIVRERLFDRIHPDDRQRVQRSVERAISGQERYDIEYRVVGPNGQIRWLHSTGQVSADEAGKPPTRLDGVVMDITERRRLITGLQSERAKLANIIEQAPAFICTLRGPEHVFELANERYYEIVGHRDVIGKPVRDALPEVAGQGFFELMDRVYQTGETFAGSELPLQLQRTEGDALEDRYINVVYQATRDNDGRISGIFVHGVDVTDFVLARDALRQSEARFRQLADAMPQIVWAARPDGTVDYYNKRWHEYTGMPEGLTGDESWTPLAPPEDLKLVFVRWTEALRTGQPYEVECRFRRSADGAYRWHLARALPVRDAHGDIVRWFGTNTDIHDFKLLQEQNEQLLESERSARTEAERASRMKDEFLATLSHELRTPLNAILGWSQILRMSNRDEGELEEGLQTIERNARAQTQIIEDLLDMSRIISGKVRLDVQPVDLTAVVSAAIDTVRPAAAAKRVQVQSVLDPLTHPVSADPNRLQQVFWNLLSNAVKFTPSGGRVQVSVHRVNSHIEVSVTDTGEGINPQFLPHVFDRFRQADASTTRRHGGLGLGLSIVKQLTELHGGSVRVTSRGAGTGATFIVALPLNVLRPGDDPDAPLRRPDAEIAVAADACAQLKGVRVLVVDDEPDARSMVQRLLSDCDAIVTAADSVAHAMQRLSEGKFDVLVSDIGMPGEDGYALIRRIRALPADRNGKVCAVALTAYARAEDRVRSILSGYDMHVSKPVEPAELIATVASLASRVR
ncbi:MAG TPA: PAS domain S-box protein [Tepidisphaeraceae bacterium]|jgi:hypothetical protein|nr:PAS domain S-box protein [Tepidisphaeraceae bacterium]